MPFSIDCWKKQKRTIYEVKRGSIIRDKLPFWVDLARSPSRRRMAGVCAFPSSAASSRTTGILQSFARPPHPFGIRTAHDHRRNTDRLPKAKATLDKRQPLACQQRAPDDRVQIWNLGYAERILLELGAEITNLASDHSMKRRRDWGLAECSAHSELWILGLYDVLRTLKETKTPRFSPLGPLFHKLELLRMPIAKHEMPDARHEGKRVRAKKRFPSSIILHMFGTRKPGNPAGTSSIRLQGKVCFYSARRSPMNSWRSQP